MRTFQLFVAASESQGSRAQHLALRADSGLSLRPQTKLGNLKKADARGCDSDFSMCKRS